MSVLALILFIAAAVVFVIAGVSKAAAPVSLTNIGLALLTVAFMCEYGARTHPVLF